MGSEQWGVVVVTGVWLITEVDMGTGVLCSTPVDMPEEIKESALRRG